MSHRRNYVDNTTTTTTTTTKIMVMMMMMILMIMMKRYFMVNNFDYVVLTNQDRLRDRSVLKTILNMAKRTDTQTHIQIDVYIHLMSA